MSLYCHYKGDPVCMKGDLLPTCRLHEKLFFIAHLVIYHFKVATISF